MIVPFAPEIAVRLPTQRITVLRSFRTVRSLVQASALLHHRHRKRDDEGRIIATLDDYRLIYATAGAFIANTMTDTLVSTAATMWMTGLIDHLAAEQLARAKAGEGKSAAALHAHGESELLARHRQWDRALRLEELTELTGRPRTTIQRYLTQLQSAGVVDQTRMNKKLAYRAAAADGSLPTCPSLPPPETLEWAGQMGTTI